jgi:hypothetical protein
MHSPNMYSVFCPVSQQNVLGFSGSMVFPIVNTTYVFSVRYEEVTTPSQNRIVRLCTD